MTTKPVKLAYDYVYTIMVVGTTFCWTGWGSKSMQTMKMLVDIFPDDIVLHHELGVSFLMIGKNSEAKQVFEQVELMNTCKMEF